MHCAQEARELYLPTRLQRILIDPAEHARCLAAAGAGAAGAAGAGAGADGAEATLGVSVLPHVGVVRAGGVELRGLKVSLAPRRLNAQAAPKLERYACTSSATKQTSNIQIFSYANRTVYRVLAVHFCFS